MKRSNQNNERKKLNKHRKRFQSAIDQIDFMIDDLISYIQGEDEVIDYIRTFRKLIKEHVKKDILGNSIYSDFTIFNKTDPFSTVRSKIESCLYTRGTCGFPYPVAPLPKKRFISGNWVSDRGQNHQKKLERERNHHQWLKNILEKDGKERFIEIIDKIIVDEQEAA